MQNRHAQSYANSPTSGRPAHSPPAPSPAPRSRRPAHPIPQQSSHPYAHTRLKIAALAPGRQDIDPEYLEDILQPPAHLFEVAGAIGIKDVEPAHQVPVQPPEQGYF